jgi:hypothetical protein
VALLSALPGALFVLGTLSLDYEWCYLSIYVQIVLCLLFFVGMGVLAIGRYRQNRRGGQIEHIA